ncbi:MAG: multicopper oxidase type 3 [Geminicoccaceae bacterium]|nr:multicopper oxidase type 3 [Geminicoccaceae bacterium]
MSVRALISFPLVLLATSFVPGDARKLSAPTAATTERATMNDNRRAAGTLRDGVLTLGLDARAAAWHPDGDSAPGAQVPAFAEAGGPPQIPGPLVRVPAGTRVVATVRNSLPNDTLIIHGLHSRGITGAATTPIRLAPGEQRQRTFQLDSAGTYYYWATTSGRTFRYRVREDAQLSGAIIVDPPNARPDADRVFMITMWSDTIGAVQPRGRKRVLYVINGRSWPNTERLSYTVGDTVRWHVINATADIHPMHLHGFYFDVESRGNGLADTMYAAPQQDRLVTELMVTGQTMRTRWAPDRDGNWAFHCHIPEHIEKRGPLGTIASEHNGHVGNHALEGMNGLVVGVHVAPRRGRPSTATTAPPGRRTFRLVIDETPNATSYPDLSFALGEGRRAPVPVPRGRIGPPIVASVGEPVSITVVNRSSRETAIHWHGIELESYFDGIAGFSGTPMRLSPAIAPRDSFEARFTPPRPGTFIYHSHVDEARQQAAGLTGAIVVLAPGERYDAASDLIAVATSPADSATESRAVILNGALEPQPLTLKAGVPHRLRMINITVGRPGSRFELRQDTTLLQWRLLARDGAELPDHRKVMERAARRLSIGQTMDVEITPRAAGPMRLEFRAVEGTLLGSMALVVTP